MCLEIMGKEELLQVIDDEDEDENDEV